MSLRTFVACNLDSTISAFTDGIFLVGSTTLHQTQLNECTGSENPAAPTLCANTAATELFLSALDVAFIESNSEQLTEQTNTCIAGASCENTRRLIGIDPFPNEFVSILAEDQAVVKADTVQGVFQDNVCGGVNTDCINFGSDLFEISAIEQAVVAADSRQLSRQENECQNGALCVNNGRNIFEISASGQASVNSEVDQGMELGTKCPLLSPSLCVDTGANIFEISASGQASVNSEVDQGTEIGTKCQDSVCVNTAVMNMHTTGASGQGSINSKAVKIVCV